MTHRTARLAGALAALVVGLGLPAAARSETRVGGPITGDVRWEKAGSPYLAYEDVVVEPGAHLEIGPGVTVRFKANINDQQGFNKFDLELMVRGTLTIRGAASDTVVVTSDSVDPTWFDWQGIVLDGDKAVVDIEAARISFANAGVRAQGGTVKLRNVTLSECSQTGAHLVGARGVLDRIYSTSVGNTGGTGIGVWLDQKSDVDITNSYLVGVQNGVQYSRESTGKLDKTIVTVCTGAGVRVQNSTPRITGCTITANEYGIICGGGATPVITGNNIFDNGGVDLQLAQYTGKVVQIDATGNWWGTGDLAVVEERVRDGLDDPKVRAFANIEPILTDALSTEESSGP